MSTDTHTDTTTIHPHLALVTALFARFDRQDVDGIGELLHEDFISHNPRVPHDPSAASGREAFLTFLRSPDGERLLSANIDIRRMAVEGDHVWVHNHLTHPGTPGVAAVDIVRIEDGLAVEHWDVVQPVPAELPHPHGMF
jgi:predicted SnoaL-like aldol condensation-catalyzing enzyme